MAKQQWKYLWTGMAAGALIGAGLWLYSQRPKGRIPTPEGIEDPEIARGFGWIARMPPMRLMRWLAVSRAIDLGEAHFGEAHFGEAHFAATGEWPKAIYQAADLGCGPGWLVIELARRAPGLHVTGIDLAEEMLAQGRENALRAGVADRVAFRLGDAARIPFEDAALDLVVSTLSLHHWSQPVAVLDEIARVLRPGGAFLITDLRRDLSAPAWLLLWLAQHVVVPKAIRRAGEPLASRNAAYTPAEAAELARCSALRGWRVSGGPLWLTIEGRPGVC
jgi:SAM-dependent methyltransferase